MRVYSCNHKLIKNNHIFEMLMIWTDQSKPSSQFKIISVLCCLKKEIHLKVASSILCCAQFACKMSISKENRLVYSCHHHHYLSISPGCSLRWNVFLLLLSSFDVLGSVSIKHEFIYYSRKFVKRLLGYTVSAVLLRT